MKTITGEWKRLALLMCIVLLLAAAIGVGMAVPAQATDPMPQSVVAGKTVILDGGATAYAAAHNSDYVVSRYYGVADIFVSIAMTSTDSITATIQHSPDGATWYNGASFTAVTTSTSAYAMTRTALYGEYMRVTFALSGTVGYTPTVKATLKNN